ncbi:hypothetical protein ACXYMX_10280 [Sporosarcina sp. CAU 1771]
MPSNKTLSSLCYFSLFFSPLLLPFVIYLFIDDREVKRHAKLALISHMIPVALLIIGFIVFSLSMFSAEKRMLDMMNGNFGFWSYSPVLFMFFYGFFTILIFIWNIVQGVKSLK